MHESQPAPDSSRAHIVRDLLGEALASLRRRDEGRAEYYIRRAWKVAGPPEETLKVGGLAPWQVRRLKEFLETNFCDEVTVSQASKVISRSPSLLCRAFRVSFGCSFHQYLIRLRLQRACRLMLTTSSQLSAIASACGLADQAHFSRRFKHAFGESPAAWRRRHLDTGSRNVNDLESAATSEL